MLEVVRLASSDAKRKEVERLIDVYAAERSEEQRGAWEEEARRKGKRVEMVQDEEDEEGNGEMKVTIEQLEEMERMSVVGEVERISIDTLEEMERRSIASASPNPMPVSSNNKPMRAQKESTRMRTPSPPSMRRHTTTTIDPPITEEKRRKRTSSSSPKPSTSTSSPSRRLRKRSDTLTTSTSTEAKDSGAVRRKRREAETGGEKTSGEKEREKRARSRSKEAKVLGGSLGRMLRGRG